MGAHEQRPWDESWAQLEQTIHVQDVWLLTDHIKLHYLSPYLRPGITALEVGCGSAKLSGLLAPHVGAVTGLDLSPQALRVARNNFWRTGRHRPICARRCADPAPAQRSIRPGFFDRPTGAFPRPDRRDLRNDARPAAGLFFSDIAPLKFSLLWMGFYLRGHHKQAFDEFPSDGRDISLWLRACGLQETRVFASGIVPPLGIVRRSTAFRNFAFRHEGLWRKWDDTRLAKWLGFFYLAFGAKPQVA
jgi:SAM-dependent methyltransferase